MKKIYRSLFCLLAVLMLSVSVLPSASALFSKKLYYYGVVEGVSRTVEGKVESILVTAEEQETYQMIVTDSTVWQDHDEKTTSDPATLAVGEQICVVHDPAVMMSLPPQSVAYTVIRNFPAGTDLEQEARDAVKRADAKVRSVFSGQINPELNDVRYYILLLTGVGGRVMVRRFERGNYRELHEKLETWYRDLQLVNLGGGAPMKPCKLTARLLRLMKYQKTDSRPFERLGNELSGITPAVISSVLTGSPLPDTVAARSLAYIRSKMLSQNDEEDSTSIPVPDGLACQWLKVWLIRKHSGKENQLMEKYNMDHPNPAYHCGGQMAVYAAIQHAAMPDVNAGIVQRYYASAIQTPAMVMGQLSHRATHHLDKMTNQWLAREYQKLLAELSVAIGDTVPAALTLEDQSYFALGYYQMSAELNRRRAERLAENQKKNTTNADDTEG